jgi:DNA-binding NarL/FixJ family response regulator
VEVRIARASVRRQVGGKMSEPRPLSAKPSGSPRDHRRSLKSGASAAGPRLRRVLASLTPREREVLSWLARGSTNRQIGLALDVSPRTIEKHVERILAKLGAANRTMAALLSTEIIDS